MTHAHGQSRQDAQYGEHTNTAAGRREIAE